LLEGKNVNLRVMEREDLSVLQEWDNNPEFMGEYEPFRQETRTDLERTYDDLKDAQWFFVQKKDETRIGYIAHFLAAGKTEIGYFVVPSERGKGYVSEAIKTTVDCIFQSKNVERVQAKADPENIASWKALEKAGFKREGVLRRTFYCRGKWRDDCMYSVIREEWREPRPLTFTI
jgi:RimJ/RimL family protein N-acetyltransferase